MLAISVSLLALLSASALAAPLADPAQVQVSVFYESRCPNSQAFFENNLMPAYATFGDAILNVTLVPFGRAVTVATPWERNDYVCQHGILECQGDNLHACYLLGPAGKAASQNTTMNFINCQFLNIDTQYPGDLVRSCGAQYGIDAHALELCAYDQHIYPLYLDILANTTKQITDTEPLLPFITVNGVQLLHPVYEFVDAICKAYTLKCSVQPILWSPLASGPSQCTRTYFFLY